MEYSGFARDWDRVVFRGDPASREFIAFWLVEDRVVAGMNVNVWDVTDPIRRLIRERVAVDDRRLADPDVPLDELVAASERGERGMNRLQALHDAGVSIWLDTLSRELLDSGALRRADRRLRGDRRDLEPDDLRQGDHRLGPLRRPASRRGRLRGATTRRSCSSSSRSTTSAAPPTCCAPPTTQSDGRDGFISFECTPDLADDTDGTIEQALELWARLARPNVMIKVPATEAGIPAIEELTARGVNVNVTLLFSLARYEQVIDAYIAGLERRAAAGEPVDAHRLGRVVLRLARRRQGRRAASRRLRRCAAASRSPTPTAPTPATASASPTSAGGRSPTPAPARSGRCGPAPAPRTPPTPTCSTSSS